MDAIKDLPINVVDLAVLAVLLISAVFAYARGLIHEILSIGGWIGAIFATIYGYPYIQPFARKLIPIQLVADLAAGVLFFVVTLFTFSLIIRGISKHVQESSLNILDRSLGFLFGLARGAVIICLVYMGIEFLMSPAEQPKWVTGAKSMPLILKGADAIRAVIPEDVEKTLRSAVPGADKDKGKATSPLPLNEKDLMKRLLTPPAKSEEPAKGGAYNQKQRTDMERLIENSTGK